MVKKILVTLFIGASLVMMFYPWISNFVNQHQADITVDNYKKKEKSLSEEQKEEMWKKAQMYNADLAKNQVELTDPFVESKSAIKSGLIYNNLLNIDKSGMMCYLEIPCINVNLPVFHGTAASTLERGIGHLEGSSLPVGGKSTHAVLTGHTGLNNAKLFTDLTEVKEGDLFFLHTLGKDLAYRVIETEVVLPEETQDLLIRKGKDLVTLITCTPYGVNSHRLFVTGIRTKYTPEEKENAKDDRSKDSQWMNAYKKAAIIGLAIALAMIILLKGFSKVKEHLAK
ncbi:class C sortase [Anaerobutyricum hallii]|uniref:class C sortase n=1 Tax=Anaerobutyricum hallii TaxID=39488 RepID=UPI0035202908